MDICSSLVKQKRILFVLDGWGQRVLGQIIRAQGCRRTFGRGDNRAQLLLPEGQRCPSAPGSPPNLLQVFLDPDPGTVRGITRPPVSLKSEFLGLPFRKKGSLF